ncbi:uncharacterized membrane protein YgdD (TMEM256/DUF423 family) [Brevundimonas alba]|uniref:Uncharacterized membrane protein YgdD (TMEM256/DUF423 family) n=1 Tax=Brevundimonas alba TaxID=74314 RepID=A0A7X6BNT9_9CAUL|nr:DUF423 domain-containing protein [Brevundimonas alba]NJC42533.1 uncharacterized membrane protein YgdD (TMEM256/DUF423 family) [Brevundimonas alba]
MTVDRSLVVFAALNGAMAVTLGAFAAHGAGPQIKQLLTTGAHYQLAHAIVALICAVWPARNRLIVIAGWLAAAGGLIFALALSAIALLSLPAMGAVAPVGGLMMIVAWLLIAIAALRTQAANA